jgi:hypothetical protein
MFKTVDQKIKQERMTICRSCEYFNHSFSTCQECGCYMPAKATFASAECPQGKWKESEPGQNLINTIEEMILESWNK